MKLVRQILSLAWQAAKVEIARRKDPAPEPAPPVAVKVTPAPAPKASSKWESNAFHTEALKSKTCPDCGEPKKIGSYRCAPCHEIAVSSASKPASKKPVVHRVTEGDGL
jgi:hypothetical protein